MSIYEEDLPVYTNAAAALPQASTAPEARIQRLIRPLGEQIIIRVFPPSSVGSIIIPDSAKGSTHQGEKGDLVHFVEAEVVAVGPGKRGKDSRLMQDMADLLRAFQEDSTTQLDVELLLERFDRGELIPLTVKPGDRILYHPAVQSFDRRIDPELLGLPASEECYICNEMTSVLAILEKE
jgi:co-chaperonin GroES (HSP10)